MPKPKKGFFAWKEVGAIVLGPDHIYISGEDEISQEEKNEIIRKIKEYFQKGWPCEN